MSSKITSEQKNPAHNLQNDHCSSPYEVLWLPGLSVSWRLYIPVKVDHEKKLKALKNAVYFLPKIITAKDSYYLAYQEQWGILFSNRFVIKIQTNILNISSLQLFLVLLGLDQVRLKTNKTKKDVVLMLRKAR